MPASHRAAVLDVGCFSAHLLVVERSLSRQVSSHKTRLRLDEAIDASGRITDRVAAFPPQHNVAMSEPLGSHNLVAATVLDRYDVVSSARVAA